MAFYRMEVTRRFTSAGPLINREHFELAMKNIVAKETTNDDRREIKMDRNAQYVFFDPGGLFDIL